jgi:hypothetical protein
LIVAFKSMTATAIGRRHCKLVSPTSTLMEWASLCSPPCRHLTIARRIIPGRQCSSIDSSKGGRRKGDDFVIVRAELSLCVHVFLTTLLLLQKQQQKIILGAHTISLCMH